MRVAIEVGDKVGRNCLDERLGVYGCTSMIEICFAFKRQSLAKLRDCRVPTFQHGVFGGLKTIHIRVIRHGW